MLQGKWFDASNVFQIIKNGKKNKKIRQIRVLSYNVIGSLFVVHRSNIFWNRAPTLRIETLITSQRNPFIFALRQYEQ